MYKNFLFAREIYSLTDLQENCWFNKYKKLGKRFITTKIALNLFLQRKSNLIVEIGTMRLTDDWGDGCSTLVFGDFCCKHNKQLITVDINPENVENCKKTTKEFSRNITYCVCEGIEFLRNFDEPIDLLYLDSFDCPIGIHEDDNLLFQSQTQQKTELRSALKNLRVSSIVLLDDNNFDNGGKTKLAKQLLVKEGWELVLDSYQSLWIRS